MHPHKIPKIIRVTDGYLLLFLKKQTAVLEQIPQSTGRDDNFLGFLIEAPV